MCMQNFKAGFRANFDKTSHVTTSRIPQLTMNLNLIKTNNSVAFSIVTIINLCQISSDNRRSKVAIGTGLGFLLVGALDSIIVVDCLLS